MKCSSLFVRYFEFKWSLNNCFNSLITNSLAMESVYLSSLLIATGWTWNERRPCGLKLRHRVILIHHFMLLRRSIYTSRCFTLLFACCCVSIFQKRSFTNTAEIVCSLSLVVSLSFSSTPKWHLLRSNERAWLYYVSAKILCRIKMDEQHQRKFGVFPPPFSVVTNSCQIVTWEISFAFLISSSVLFPFVVCLSVRKLSLFAQKQNWIFKMEAHDCTRMLFLSVFWFKRTFHCNFCSMFTL